MKWTNRDVLETALGLGCAAGLRERFYRITSRRTDGDGCLIPRKREVGIARQLLMDSEYPVFVCRGFRCIRVVLGHESYILLSGGWQRIFGWVAERWNWRETRFFTAPVDHPETLSCNISRAQLVDYLVEKRQGLAAEIAMGNVTGGWGIYSVSRNAQLTRIEEFDDPSRPEWLQQALGEVFAGELGVPFVRL